MFKIPNYDDIEKKESEFNSERKGYTASLFLKRKQSDEEGSEETVKKTLKESSEDESKKAATPPSTKEIIKPVTNLEDQKVYLNDDDDDDEDLLNFINENKELIEKPKQINESENSSKVSKEQEVAKKAEASSFKNHNAQTGTVTTASGNTTSGSLTVSSKQRGNLILKHIKNVPWKYCDQLTPDFQMGKRTCGFFLSMKYHLLYPTYIHKRVKELGRAYEVRVLLCLVDVKEPHHCIKELEKVSIFSNLTMILCWSNEEVARYLETYKAYEFKSAEAIMEKATTTAINPSSNTSNASNSDANFINILTDFLCQIKSVNKTDASTLRQTFGSVKQLSIATKDELNLCPGLGPLKVNRIYEIFRTPFLNTNNSKMSKTTNTDKQMS